MACNRDFMVTRGAISQIVTQLHKMGMITKTRRTGNDKEIILELTEKGRTAFDLHEQYNQSTVTELLQLREKYSQEELRVFLRILSDVDRILTDFVVAEKQR